MPRSPKLLFVLMGTFFLASSTSLATTGTTDEMWQSLLNAGMKRRTANDCKQAERLFRKALKHAEQVEAPDDRLARSLHELGVTLRLEGKLKEAQKHQQRAVQLVEAADTRDAVSLAEYRAGLASTYGDLRRDDEAAILFCDALPVLRRHFGRNSPEYTGAREEYDAVSKRLTDAAATRARDDASDPIHGGPTPDRSPAQYETRYVNGTLFQIGTSGDLQVWIAVSLEPEGWGTSGQLDAMLYVVNDSEGMITFFPERVTVEAVKQTRNGPKIEPIKTFSAEQYEQKVRNNNIGAAFLATDFSHLNDSEGSTSHTRGSYDVRDASGRTVGSVTYSGTTTREPTAAEKQASVDRAQAKREALRDRLDASYQAMTRNLMRTHTLSPHTYYGGMVYMTQRGKKLYAVTVPFGGKDFEFSFNFAR